MLYDILMESKDYGLSRLPELAQGHAAERFGIPVETADRVLELASATISDRRGAERASWLFMGMQLTSGVIEPVPNFRFWERSSKEHYSDSLNRSIQRQHDHECIHDHDDGA